MNAPVKYIIFAARHKAVYHHHMRILELNFEKSWRGGERQTLYNMIGLRDAGHDVQLVCRKGFPLQQKAAAAGFTTFGYDSIFPVLFFLITKGSRYQLLHAQTAQILTYCVFTKLFHQRPVFFSRRVDFVPKGFFTRLKYAGTTKIFAISSAIKKIVEDFTGRKDIELISSIVLPSKPDQQRAAALLQEANIAPRKHIIGTTAALVQHKDPLTLVTAIHELRKLRSDFIFLHFGKGPLEALLQEKILALNLQDHYKLMGFYEEVEDFFAVFDVFVMSSEEEGLGSSVLDAFMQRVPVVTTTAGGLAELAADNRAISCDVHDAPALARGINDLLNDPAATTTMVDKAWQYAHEKHSMEYIIEQYNRSFRAVLNK